MFCLFLVRFSHYVFPSYNDKGKAFPDISGKKKGDSKEGSSSEATSKATGQKEGTGGDAGGGSGGGDRKMPGGQEMVG